MKSFIYLDTNTINSYIAQIDDGLKTLQTSTFQNSTDISKQNAHSVNSEGNIDISILGKGIDAKLDYIYNHLRTSATSNLYSDVETKVLHDNAFRQVVEYLEKNELFAKDNIEIGQFIKTSGDFHLLDLEYYKKLFDEQEFIEMMIDPQLSELNKKLESQFQENVSRLTVNRDGKRSSAYKEAEKKLQTDKKKARDTLIESINSVGKQLSLMLKIFPYKSLMYINNYLVIFDEQFLREDIQKAPFKYGGKINVVGYVTNTTHTNERSSFFSGPVDLIYTIIKELFDCEDDMYVIHPIALYYE